MTSTLTISSDIVVLFTRTELDEHLPQLLGGSFR
jgi:hypothetical protein